MKERIRGRALDEPRPYMTPVTLFTQCNFKTTYHPQVANWRLRQFHTAVSSSNSIHGETDSRVANSEQTVRLADGLKVAQVCPTTIFTKRNVRLATSSVTSLYKGIVENRVEVARNTCVLGDMKSNG